MRIQIHELHCFQPECVEMTRPAEGLKCVDCEVLRQSFNPPEPHWAQVFENGISQKAAAEQRVAPANVDLFQQFQQVRLGQAFVMLALAQVLRKLERIEEAQRSGSSDG